MSKVEYCYRKVEPKKHYSKLLLGELFGHLKSFHDENIVTLYGRIAEWSNELSHDSGIPVTKDKVEALCAISWAYLELLSIEIKREFRTFGKRRHKSAG